MEAGRARTGEDARSPSYRLFFWSLQFVLHAALRNVLGVAINRVY